MFSNVTFLYFLLLIPLSGFIAWVGDRIGHKSGKKRHTLFGLRPRHTAMVFTIGTGMAISLLSFSLVWALSANFRTLMAEGSALIDKNNDLKRDNQLLQTGNDALRQQSGDLARQATEDRAQAQTSRQEAQTADHRRAVAVAKATQAEKQAAQAEAQAKDARAQLETATRSRDQARADLLQNRAQLARLTRQLNVKASELTAANARVARAERQMADADRRLLAAQHKAQEAENNAKRIRLAAASVLKDQQQRQEKALAALRDQLTDQTKLYNDQREKIEQQKRDLALLDKQVLAGRNQLLDIRNKIGALRERQITYRNGEEVDRIAINSGRNIWRIEAILGAFLTTAAKKAEARGAAHTPDGDRRAVVILPKLLPSSNSDETRVVTESDSVRAAATAIRTRNADVVVLARATANAVAGEPVPVEFKIYTNPVVLAADETVAETSINGSGSGQQIQDALTNFLHQKVRPALLQKGIIPPQRGGGSEPPPARDSDGPPNTTATVVTASHNTADADALLINFSGDEWLQVLDKIREAGPRARVTARAARSLRAGDAPVLRFEVRGGLLGGAQSAVLRALGR